jgi:hypothetical protein
VLPDERSSDDQPTGSNCGADDSKCVSPRLRDAQSDAIRNACHAGNGRRAEPERHRHVIAFQEKKTCHKRE